MDQKAKIEMGVCSKTGGDFSERRVKFDFSAGQRSDREKSKGKERIGADIARVSKS